MRELSISKYLIPVTYVLLATTTALGVQPSVWQNCQLINEGWLYLEADGHDPPSADETGYVAIRLPHTWNAEDTISREEYRRSASWYRKLLNFSSGDLKDRHFLRFGAAGQQALVYVNGQQVGEHRGGYAAFTFEISDVLRSGVNRLDVRVSNAEDADLGPIDADFNFYGGLYRSVQLIRAPQICLSRTTRGGPGVRVWSEKVGDEAADVHCRTVIDNHSGVTRELRVKVELRDPTGQVVSEYDSQEKVSGVASVELKLPDVVRPLLWSPESPNLYQLRVCLMEGDQQIDEATVNYGFRWCRFTSDGQFFLNGERYDLHGVNRHQDLEGSGNATSLEHHERDIKLIKELGANWLRLAHYQQDDYVLDLCDRLGLLVWEEIPFVNILTDTDAFRNNYELMLRELIEQHHNHPSIIMWGVQNEIFLKQKGQLEGEKVALTRHLAAVAREEDPRRVIVQAGHGVTRYGELGLPAITDVMGYNVYNGWYGGKPADLSASMERLRQLQPDRPHVISEYGAGSDVRIHTEKAKSQDFSEEFQVHYLESYLDQFDQMKICGTLWWNMFDFGAAHRGDTIPHVNQKGLITFDRKTKKDAWYLLKSRWSEEPVLYLASPRFTERTGDRVKTYRAFTNFDEVELLHQGKSLGKQTEEFQWEVKLEPGGNRLLALGRKEGHVDQHGFTVTYTPDESSSPSDTQPYIPRKAEWQLIWSDEFDSPGLPNPEFWELEEGFIRNSELQYYTVNRAQNARVEDGKLIIEAHREQVRNSQFDANGKGWQRHREFAEYSSASVTTKGKKDLLYGRIDVRTKLPQGRGVWPAIWILGRKYDNIGWPLCGELDIMEHVGYLPDKVWSAIHTEKYNWTKGTQRKRIITLADANSEFHVYSLHWFTDRLECFVDGQCHFTYFKQDDAMDSWPFNGPFHLIVNFAIGGGLGGKEGVDNSVFPQKFEIDYVRVYQEASAEPH